MLQKTEGNCQNSTHSTTISTPIKMERFPLYETDKYFYKSSPPIQSNYRSNRKSVQSLYRLVKKFKILTNKVSHKIQWRPIKRIINLDTNLTWQSANDLKDESYRSKGSYWSVKFTKLVSLFWSKKKLLKSESRSY